MRAGPESFGSQVEAGEGISGLGFRAYRVCSRAIKSVGRLEVGTSPPSRMTPTLCLSRP